MKATTANNMGNMQEIQQSSELMGFRAMGVVMGPLMLGTMGDQLQPSPQAVSEGTPRRSMDSVRKADKKSEKKQKRSSGTDKLSKDAKLTALVDRANITAAVTERLLIIWKEVVLELRAALEVSMSLSSPDASKRLPERTRWAGNRHDLGSSDENMLFMDMLKSAPKSTNFQGTFKMKSKVRVGKSPMSHSFRKASSDLFESQSTIASRGEMNDGDTGVRIAIEDTDPQAKHFESSSTESANSRMTTGKDLQEEQRTKSDIAMDEMSMGTILPPPKDTVKPFQEDMVRSASHRSTLEMRPDTPQIDESPYGTPETALRDTTRRETETRSVLERNGSILGKPLPPIGAAQFAELSPMKSKEQKVIEELSSNFPARQSSLPQGKGRQRQLSSKNAQAQQRFNESAPLMKPRSRSSMTPTRRNMSQYDLKQNTDGKLSP